MKRKRRRERQAQAKLLAAADGERYVARLWLAAGVEASSATACWTDRASPAGNQAPGRRPNLLSKRAAACLMVTTRGSASSWSAKGTSALLEHWLGYSLETERTSRQLPMTPVRWLLPSTTLVCFPLDLISAPCAAVVTAEATPAMDICRWSRD